MLLREGQRGLRLLLFISYCLPLAVCFPSCPRCHCPLHASAAIAQLMLQPLLKMPQKSTSELLLGCRKSGTPLPIQVKCCVSAAPADAATVAIAAATASCFGQLRLLASGCCYSGSG